MNYLCAAKNSNTHHRILNLTLAWIDAARVIVLFEYSLIKCRIIVLSNDTFRLKQDRTIYREKKLREGKIFRY